MRRKNDLESIARKCVEEYENELFSGRASDPLTFYSHYLKEDLIDHLILLFAYKYYAEHLTPKTVGECSSIFYRIEMQGQQTVNPNPDINQKQQELDRASEEKEELKKRATTVKRRIIKYLNNLGAAVELYYNRWNKIKKTSKTSKAAALKKLRRQYCKQDPKATGSKRDKLLLPVPVWQFIIAQSCCLKENPFYVKKDSDKFQFESNSEETVNTWRQIHLMLTSQFSPLLFDIGSSEPSIGMCDYKVPIYLYEGRYDEKMVNNRIAVQKYKEITKTRKKKTPETGEREIEIPQAIQFMLNSYLIEKNFHIRAIYAIERECIGIHEDIDVLIGQFSECVKLRAVTLHLNAIRAIGSVARHIWGGDFGTINRTLRIFQDWNETILPKLEKDFFKSARQKLHGDKFDAIEKSLLSDDKKICRCNRLNYFYLAKYTAQQNKDTGLGEKTIEDINAMQQKKSTDLREKIIKETYQSVTDPYWHQFKGNEKTRLGSSSGVPGL